METLASGSALQNLTAKLLRLRQSDVTSRKEAGKVIGQLRAVIEWHNQRYYGKDDPLISDAEYDRLLKLMQNLEAKWPEWASPASPTQRIPTGTTKVFPFVRHLTPMLSLDNSYEEADILVFDRRVREVVGPSKLIYTVEPKFDGAGISLVYENNLLARGATRGDGVAGEEITNNLRMLLSLPLSAPFSRLGIYRIEIRGEVLIPKEIFKKMNRHRLDEGLPPFANARNAASGSIRLQDSREVAPRGLEVFVYQVTYATDKNGQDKIEHVFCQQHHTLQVLQQAGFRTSYNYLKKALSINQVLDYCREWQSRRDAFPYEIDGMVIKVDDLTWCRQLGFTSHHPRWTMALKFKARQATTRLMDVIYQVGRTGAVTPVAKLEPVAIGGVIITSVSLHNEDFIRLKDIRVGDSVLVERAGDVIPYLVKVNSDVRTGPEKKIVFPANCPACDSKLVKPVNESIWRCNNLSCPAQVVERIIHFASKTAMDINGMGEQTVRLLYAKDLLRNITDLYRLDWNQINQLPGFGSRTVANLQQAIEKSKQQPLHRLLIGLSIRYIGENTAKILAEQIHSLPELELATGAKLQNLPGLGPKASQSLCLFFHNSQNRNLIQELLRAGINPMPSEPKPAVKQPLVNLTFVFTGALSHYSRQEAKRLVESKGGKVSDAISSRTNYLVVGQSPGSKLANARQLTQVKIIDEPAFEQILKMN